MCVHVPGRSCGVRSWEPQHIVRKSFAVVACRSVELEGLCVWHPQSPDLTRICIFMCGLLKKHIHVVSARTIGDLVARPWLA